MRRDVHVESQGHTSEAPAFGNIKYWHRHPMPLEFLSSNTILLHPLPNKTVLRFHHSCPALLCLAMSGLRLAGSTLNPLLDSLLHDFDAVCPESDISL
jgi:hypothetical protein